VVVTGTDRVTGWRSAGSGLFEATWTHDWGFQQMPHPSWDQHMSEEGVSPLVRRREAVWDESGRILRQVLTRDELLRTPGSFLVEEDADRLLVRPEDPRGFQAAEVAVRERALDLQGWRNVTISGMTFQRTASRIQGPAVRVVDSSSIVLEDLVVQDSNWTGLALQKVQDVVVRRTALLHNGVTGLSGFQTERLLLEDVENSRNNTWRGAWSGFYGWENGAKLFAGRDITIRRWTAVENETVGLWLDTDLEDVVIEDSYIARNRLDGIFLESIQGPVAVRNNVVCQNGTSGILDGKSDQVTLENNQVTGNGRAQLVFSGERGGRKFREYDTGTDRTITSTGWTIRGNFFAGGPQPRSLVGNNLDDADWSRTRDSLIIDGNRWSAPSAAQSFSLPGRTVDFETWRAATGGEGSSTFTVTDGVSCSPPTVSGSQPAAGLSTSATVSEGSARAIERGRTPRDLGSFLSYEVKVVVKDAADAPLEGVDIEATWSGTGGQFPASCTTASGGRCTFKAPTEVGVTNRLTIDRVSSPAVQLQAASLPLEVKLGG